MRQPNALDSGGGPDLGRGSPSGCQRRGPEQGETGENEGVFHGVGCRLLLFFDECSALRSKVGGEGM